MWLITVVHHMRGGGLGGVKVHVDVLLSKNALVNAVSNFGVCLWKALNLEVTPEALK